MALCPRPSRARWAVSASCSAVCDHICCCTAGAGTGAGDPPLRSRPPKTMWWSTWRTTWPAAAAGVVTAGGCVPLRSCCHSAQQQLLPSGTVVATTGSSAAVSTLHRGSWAGCLRHAASAGSSGPGAIGAVVRVGAAPTSGEATAPRCRSWSCRAGPRAWAATGDGSASRQYNQVALCNPTQCGPGTVGKQCVGEAVCAVCATCARVVGNLERVVFSSLDLFSTPVASFFGRFRPHLSSHSPRTRAAIAKRFAQGPYCTPVDADDAQLGANPPTWKNGSIVTTTASDTAPETSGAKSPQTSIMFSDAGSATYSLLHNSARPRRAARPSRGQLARSRFAGSPSCHHGAGHGPPRPTPAASAQMERSALASFWCHWRVTTATMPRGWGYTFGLDCARALPRQQLPPQRALRQRSAAARSAAAATASSPERRGCRAGARWPRRRPVRWRYVPAGLSGVRVVKVRRAIGPRRHDDPPSWQRRRQSRSRGSELSQLGHCRST